MTKEQSPSITSSHDKLELVMGTRNAFWTYKHVELYNPIND